jgi:Zn-dependent peptidase ImmA (M78 family)
MHNLSVETAVKNALAYLEVQELPISVESIAFHLGIKLKPLPFDDDMSGVLIVKKNNKSIIGYNEEHKFSRRRFTIAHELGHYFLHRDQDSIFVDNFKVFNRDKRSSSGEDKIEIEANDFAAKLLMPEELIKKEVTEGDYDFSDEASIEKLAQKFLVSKQAMNIRLARLDFLAFG